MTPGLGSVVLMVSRLLMFLKFHVVRPSFVYEISVLESFEQELLSALVTQEILNSLEPEIEGGTYAAMNTTPATSEAEALVVAVLSVVLEYEKAQEARARHDEMAKAFAAVLSGFLGDLLRALASERAEGWVYRSMKKDEFTGKGVLSARRFASVVAGLTGAGLLNHEPGYQRWSASGFAEGGKGVPMVTESKAARFSATAKLIGMAEDAGITPGNVREHFVLRLPEVVIIANPDTVRKRGTKSRGKPLDIRKTPELEHLIPVEEALAADVKRLNSFLDGFVLTGGSHRGYTRQFNQADLPEFAFNRGGRLYSQGEGSYQGMKPSNRLAMTISGKPVAELDIKASYLTVLHGLLKEPFDPRQDPYRVDTLQPFEVEGDDLRRWVVKSWTVATLGYTGHFTRWPSTLTDAFRRKTGETLGKRYPIEDVRRAMTDKFPVLELWGELKLSWANLMYAESEAMTGTMLELMDRHSIPSLAIHDSLLVRQGDVGVTRETLEHHYQSSCGILPMIEVKLPSLSTPPWPMGGPRV